MRISRCPWQRTKNALVRLVNVIRGAQTWQTILIQDESLGPGQHELPGCGRPLCKRERKYQVVRPLRTIIATCGKPVVVVEIEKLGLGHGHLDREAWSRAFRVKIHPVLVERENEPTLLIVAAGHLASTVCPRDAGIPDNDGEHQTSTLEDLSGREQAERGSILGSIRRIRRQRLALHRGRGRRLSGDIKQGAALLEDEAYGRCDPDLSVDGHVGRGLERHGEQMPQANNIALVADGEVNDCPDMRKRQRIRKWTIQKFGAIPAELQKDRGGHN
mmetsp:Transcript_147292/g.473178  ORF Transcript_147292/g.473178 Transcript_147292/m.473178 type:complete len:274 (-) Transcript_147292:5181-6002(-)